MVVQGPETQLVMKGCYLHGVPHSAAVFAEAGKVQLEGGQNASASAIADLNVNLILPHYCLLLSTLPCTVMYPSISLIPWT